MQQQISVITLGVVDLDRSRRFYVDGFGWSPVFENEEIIFYQMNGLMLGTWLQSAFGGRHAAVWPVSTRRFRIGTQRPH